MFKKILCVMIFSFILCNNAFAISFGSKGNPERAIIYSINQYNLNKYEFRALANILLQDKVNLSGFWGMHIGYYTGMSAESYILSLANIVDTAGIQSVIKDLVPVKNEGIKGEEYYYKELKKLKLLSAKRGENYE